MGKQKVMDHIFAHNDSNCETHTHTERASASYISKANSSDKNDSPLQRDQAIKISNINLESLIAAHSSFTSHKIPGDH